MTVNKNIVLLDVTQGTRVFQNSHLPKNIKVPLSTPLRQTVAAEV